MPLSDVISRFSTAAADATAGYPPGYPVIRWSDGPFSSNGIYQGGATVVYPGLARPLAFPLGPYYSFMIDATVQPFDPRSLVLVPEGVRAEDVRVLDTTTPMQVQPPDRVIIAGDLYSVFRVDGPTYHFGGPPRYTAYLARQEVPG